MNKEEFEKIIDNKTFRNKVIMSFIRTMDDETIKDAFGIDISNTRNEILSDIQKIECFLSPHIPGFHSFRYFDKNHNILYVDRDYNYGTDNTPFIGLFDVKLTEFLNELPAAF